MYSFKYKHGDRPLEGYTIQRAAGRGGFGEVYYAISDSGREVALKAVQGYEQIELRGIGQCMNLKSPHLVTIFDVKYNDEGRPFVIMEYVSGPSLRQLLDESPSGLGEQKSAFFLREIGKGLSFLHECGVVHRDMKPGNIFYENGYVKIGDYGLSKALGPAVASGQTVTVGTLHYMAPEIGAGKYDRSIDIYALGAVLYEMLTGIVPFVGASPTEILMKHLSVEPDVSMLSEPFKTVVKRAMAKDAAQRYQTVQEMVEAVFGSEQVRQSMSVFSPEELSVVAGRVAAKMPVAAGAGGSSGQSPGLGGAWQGTGTSSSAAPGRPTAAARFNVNIGSKPPPIPARSSFQGAAMPGGNEGLDPLSLPYRLWLAGGIVLIAGMLAGALTRSGVQGWATLAASVGGILGMTLSRQFFARTLHHETPHMQRMVLAAATMIGMITLSAPILVVFQSGHGYSTWAAWMAMLTPPFLIDPRKWLDPNRSERCRLGQGIGAAVIALIVASILGTGGWMPALTAMAVASGAGALAPWWPAELRRQWAAGPAAFGAAMPAAAGPMPPVPPPRVMPPVVPIPPVPPIQGAASEPAAVRVDAAPSADSVIDPSQRLPAYIPILWLGATALSISLGVMLVVAGANRNQYSEDFAHMVSGGVSLLMFGVMSLLQSFRRSRTSIWSYIGLPLTLLACGVSIETAGIWLGVVRSHPNDDQMASVFFIVLPACTIFLMLITGLVRELGNTSPPSETVSDRSRLTALLLCVLPAAFGVAGVHRFYAGKFYTGLLWLMTWGLFGVGTVIDIIQIIAGTFRDSHNRRVLNWSDQLGLAPGRPIGVYAVAGCPAPAGSAQGPQQGDWANRLRNDIGRQVGGLSNWFDQAVRPAIDAARGTSDSARAQSKAVRESARQWRQQMRDWRRMQRNAYYAGRSVTRMSPLGWLLHFGCSIMVFAALSLTAVLALHGPETSVIVAQAMGEQGHPVTVMSSDLNQAAELAHRAGAAIIGIMVALGLTGIAVARSRGGGAHMIRGVAGQMLRFVALAVLVDSLARPAAFGEVARQIVADHNVSQASVDLFFAAWNGSGAMVAAVIFIAGILVSHWPAAPLSLPAGQMGTVAPPPIPQPPAPPIV
jgi:hypothetical protein